MNMTRSLKLVLGAAWCCASAGAGAAPPIEHWVTSNGAQVYFVAAAEIPMIDARVVFAAGSARDGAKAGLAVMTNGLLKEGAGDLDADTFAERLGATGAVIALGAERDMASASLRTLADPSAVTPALQLFAAALAHPRFDGDAFARRQARTLVGLKRKEQSPEATIEDALYATCYPDHPYGSPPSGTPASVTALTVADVRAFHQQYYVAGNAIIAIVGALDTAHAHAVADELSNALPRGERAPPVPPVVVPAPADKHIEFPSIQSHVRVGLPAVTRSDPDYFALLVGNHALGGNPLVSILFNEVRNKRGLSYNVSSYFAPMAQAGPFVAALQTDRKQQVEALAVLRSTIKQFIDEGPPPTAIDAAKQNLIDGFPLRVASNIQIVEYISMMGFYGLPLDYLEAFPRRIAEVTADAVKQAFARHVPLDHLSTIVVGRAADVAAKP